MNDTAPGLAPRPDRLKGEIKMIIWTMKRRNGDTAIIRSVGNEYAADVTTRTGRNDNANWPETYKTARECRKALEKHGFRIG